MNTVPPRHMSRRRILGLAATGLLGGTLDGRRADATTDDPNTVLHRIISRGTLNVPVMVGEEPGYVKDPATGEWSGYYLDFLRSIASVLKVDIRTVETNWGNLAADFEAGKIDVAVGVNPNAQRALVVDYLPDPIFFDAWSVLMPPDRHVSSWSELDRPESRVVVQLGSTMQIVAGAQLPAATIVPVADRATALLEMESGRTDAVVLAVFDALQIASRRINGHPLGAVSVPRPMLRSPVMLCVAREAGNEGFISYLTAWTLEQRSLGMVRASLERGWKAAGIDVAAIPAEILE
ncbi:transporter substrate-binding domain-containing protein [Gluconacetobacter takamatsuzukensis]|uniref:Transporter substrate-binding domain-containing protein n=1 Tax=Gluconacetobacter takamatsuzukensis TaxID=1286190 RepID=A0A7W4KGA7_9PROT|nr:transporter substrate-binding domain-containing protein [Gluconacetobacter takamatsuzukensis]MBB2206384.1 transporter substrate-binding domain-containing protein [Gluconacetobacter takamatsuzukensis]